MLEEFLTSNLMTMRLLRTVLEGILGVVIVSLPLIIGWWNLSPEMASLLTALIMCVFSPVLAMIKTGKPEDGLHAAKDDK